MCMVSAPTNPREKASAALPRWGWSGVSQLKLRDQESRVQHLVTMLPARNSGDEWVLAYLAHLRLRELEDQESPSIVPDKGATSALFGGSDDNGWKTACALVEVLERPDLMIAVSRMQPGGF